ncbi:unnamed protein product [Adineta ricciae]|uniref:Uncharacterized protein n=1 Tax=Adineta ricciae TaxID=249248 RepID=A0A815V0R5_ADIRI|nr:unnamed protein product [Adineta ricciae]
MFNSKAHSSSLRHKYTRAEKQQPVLINLINNNRLQRRASFSQDTNLIPISTMYGSDFFFPFDNDDQQKHQYDNLTYPQPLPHHYYDPLPIPVACQRCSRSTDRSSFRDMSCQVPSDDEEDRNIYQYVQFEHRQNKTSSPLYNSPSSTPPPCSPPLANSLLSPYHRRRKRSLSSYDALHSRSKSAPSASSSTLSSITYSRKSFFEKKSKHPLPSLFPLQSDMTVLSLTPETVPVTSTPSTTALLRSIKTSIHAMKKRLKDIRRLSEVGMCC